jgi:hypothetical protein
MTPMSQPAPNQDKGTFFANIGGTSADDFIRQSRQRFGA